MHIVDEFNQHFSFVLASQSPRRKQILHEAGLHFVCKPQHTPEHIRDKYFKKDIVTVTDAKLNAYIPQKNKAQIIIACDTIVVYAGKVFGKPKDQAHARSFLQKLSGRKHTVWSCLAVKVITPQETKAYHILDSTDVYFRVLSAQEINDYLATPHAYDKAGAYGVQDARHSFVKKINGCYYNVMGLPLAAFIELLHTIKGAL